MPSRVTKLLSYKRVKLKTEQSESVLFLTKKVLTDGSERDLATLC